MFPFHRRDTDLIYDDVFCIDLGTHISFMSARDIATLGHDVKSWPKVMKENDAKKQGLLRTGRSPIANRVAAARAYADMLYVGESKACQAASRWLAKEYQTASISAERNIRKLLQGVSDVEERKESSIPRPPFQAVSSEKLSEDEVAGWAYGVREVTAPIAAKVAGYCVDLKEGWVPLLDGGAALGLPDDEIEVVVYNKRGDANSDNLVRTLSQLSVSGLAKSIGGSDGVHLTIPDAISGSSTVHVEVFITKEGLSAHARIAQRGLFMESIVRSPGLRHVFLQMRQVAKDTGLIAPLQGMFSMRAMMAALVDYLVFNRTILIDKETPINKQTPEIGRVSEESTYFIVQGFFEWVAACIKDPDYVFGSFADSRWSRRPETEYKAAMHPRVCRDVFSTNVDNLMKSVQSARLEDIDRSLKHAAYCRNPGKHINSSKKAVKMMTGVGTVAECSLMDTVEDAPVSLAAVVTSNTVYHVFVTTPRRAVGLAQDETQARGRAFVNFMRVPKEGVVVLWGESAKREFGHKGLTWIDVLDNMDRLYCSSPKDDLLWIVGTCVKDTTLADDPLQQMDLRAIEVLVQILLVKDASEDSSFLWHNETCKERSTRI